MGGQGNCYDNDASSETEWLYRRHYTTKQQARQDLFEIYRSFYDRVARIMFRRGRFVAKAHHDCFLSVGTRR
jgi:hypothetical protein